MKKVLFILSLLLIGYTTADAQFMRSLMKNQPKKTTKNNSGYLIDQSSPGRVPSNVNQRKSNSGYLIDQSSPGTYTITRRNNSSGQKSNSDGFAIDNSSPGTYTGPAGGNVVSSDYTNETPSSSTTTTTVTQKDCRQCLGLKYCRSCGGRGVVQNSYDLRQQHKCSICSGTGVCKFCNGTGKQ